MKQLKITPRVAISIVFLLLALVIILKAYISTISDQIWRTDQERDGINYLRPLVKVIEAVGEHQALQMRLIADDNISKADLQAVNDAVSKAFDELKATGEHTEDSLLVVSEEEAKHRKKPNIALPRLLTEWKTIAAADPHAVTGEQYHELLADLKEMVAHVTEVSGLILDPDLDSYYLMHAVAVVLPNSIERIFDNEREVYFALRQQRALDAGQKSKIWALATIIEQADMVDVDNDIHTCYSRDSNYYGVSTTLRPNTQDKLEQYQKANWLLTSTLYGVMKDTPPLPTAFLAHAAAAEKSAMALINTGLTELDGLLRMRSEFIAAARNVALAKALLALIFALGFFWYVMYGITYSLKRVENAMLHVSNGDFNVEVPCQDHQDEIGNIARALEVFRKSYWWLN